MILTTPPAPWWKPWAAKSPENSVWERTARCSQTLRTSSNEHICDKQGPHYDHACRDADCSFRWASR